MGFKKRGVLVFVLVGLIWIRWVGRIHGGTDCTALGCVLATCDLASDERQEIMLMESVNNKASASQGTADCGLASVLRATTR